MSSARGRFNQRHVAAVLILIASTPLACVLDWDSRSGAASTGSTSGVQEQTLHCKMGQACTCSGTQPCNVDCAGGACDIDCHGAPSCKVSCAQACTVTCNKPGTCEQTCDYPTTCRCTGC